MIVKYGIKYMFTDNLDITKQYPTIEIKYKSQYNILNYDHIILRVGTIFNCFIFYEDYYYTIYSKIEKIELENKLKIITNEMEKSLINKINKYISYN